MTSRLATHLIWPLTMTALLLEVKPPGMPYGSVDPHGFGVLGAILISLLLMGLVLWLLLQRRRADVVAKASIGRSAAVVFAIGTPMLLQLTYLNMPFAWCWPVVASSIAWAAVVLAICLRTAPGSLSAHGAFDRHPRTAWTLVATLGLGKMAVGALALA